MLTSINIYYPPAAFYFTINIAGQNVENVAIFQEVSGLQENAFTEDISKGGENRFVHHLPKAVKFQNLILKRGVLDRNAGFSKLVNETLSGELSKPIQTKTILVSLLGADGNAMRSWKFNNAYPVKWEVSAFKPMDDCYAIESIEFAYDSFERT